MVSTGMGVWLSLQSSAVIRLFHATRYECLADVDVAPPVHKMLAGQYSKLLIRLLVLAVFFQLLLFLLFSSVVAYGDVVFVVVTVVVYVVIVGDVCAVLLLFFCC